LFQHVALHAFLRFADGFFFGHFQGADGCAVPCDHHIKRVVWLISPEDQRQKAPAHLARDNRRDQTLQPQVGQGDRHRVRAGLRDPYPVAEQGWERVGVVERVFDVGPYPGLGEVAGDGQRAQPLILHHDGLSGYSGYDSGECFEAAILGRKLQKLLADFKPAFFGAGWRAHEDSCHVALDIAELCRIRQAQEGDVQRIGGFAGGLPDFAQHTHGAHRHLGQLANQADERQFVAQQVHGIERQQRHFAARQFRKGRGARIEDMDPRHALVGPLVSGDDGCAHRERQAKQIEKCRVRRSWHGGLTTR